MPSLQSGLHHHAGGFSSSSSSYLSITAILEIFSFLKRAFLTWFFVSCSWVELKQMSSTWTSGDQHFVLNKCSAKFYRLFLMQMVLWGQRWVQWDNQWNFCWHILIYIDVAYIWNRIPVDSQQNITQLLIIVFSRSPLSALQAFAIALSSFDCKLACEWFRLQALNIH